MPWQILAIQFDSYQMHGKSCVEKVALETVEQQLLVYNLRFYFLKLGLMADYI